PRAGRLPGCRRGPRLGTLARLDAVGLHPPAVGRPHLYRAASRVAGRLPRPYPSRELAPFAWRSGDLLIMVTLRDLALRFVKLGMLPYGAIARERRPGVIILGYHRVGGGSAAQLDLPSALFEWQMEYLKRHHVVVHLDDVVQIARGTVSYPHDVVVITFDDGYEDVYRHAFPVLAKYHLPATIYLTSSYVESGSAFPSEAPSNGRGRPLTWRQAREMQSSGLVTFGAHTHTHPNFAALT